VPRPVRIADLFAEARDSVGNRFPDVQIAIRMPPAEEGLEVSADATQLRRALVNLVHNAVQACAALPADDPRPRTVELSAQPAENGTVRIVVSDSGPGIPGEVLEKIWTPFFTTRAQGTGLGLAFVREIVGDHGGQIEVTSGPPGTRFEIAWPSTSSRARR
jgi:two-component system C4-dicarboxylate transport sensor histidine kinase DctB